MVETRAKVRYRPPIGVTSRARRLRSNPTVAEAMMWCLLRDNFRAARFRRQVPIRSFIVDFASHQDKLVIEVDGGQHSDQRDAARTKVIRAEGYGLVRFWNNDVIGNPDGVAAAIAAALHALHPHPSLPHQGGGSSKEN